MYINELDVIKTHDGKEGTVLEIYSSKQDFLVEFSDGELKDIHLRDIKEVIYVNKK